MKTEKSEFGIYVVIGLILIIVGFILYSFNPYSKTQKELEKFYQVAFDNAVITSVKEYPYEGGRGTYKKFMTNQSPNRFPIMLKREFYEVQEYFVPNTILNKTSNSYEIEIIFEQEHFKATIYDYRKEDNRGNLLFLVIGGIIIISINFFRRKNKKSA